MFRSGAKAKRISSGPIRVPGFIRSMIFHPVPCQAWTTAMSTSRPSIHPRITSFSLQHYYNQTPTSLLCTYFSLRHTLALRPRIPPPPFFSTMSLSRSTFNDFLLLLNFFYFFTYSFYTSIFWRALHYGTTFRSFPFPLYIHNQGTLSHSADLSSRSYSLCRPTVSGVPVSSCSLVPRRVGINRGGGGNA